MKTILVDAVGTFVVKGNIYEPLHALLESYPNRKIVVTNANDEQIVQFGLSDLPYELFTLKHSPEKTDPTYFKVLLEHFEISPESVIYFEHSMRAVESAEKVGISAYYYDAEKKDLPALKAFLDAHL